MCTHIYVCKLSHFSCVPVFETLWAMAHQTPLSMGFSRQEYWSGLPCLPPGELPDPGIEPRSPILQADSLPAEPQGKPKNTGVGSLSLSSGSSRPRNLTIVSCIAGGLFSNELSGKPLLYTSKVMLKTLQARLQQFVN